jgi:hypothetical protein
VVSWCVVQRRRPRVKGERIVRRGWRYCYWAGGGGFAVSVTYLLHLHLTVWAPRAVSLVGCRRHCPAGSTRPCWEVSHPLSPLVSLVQLLQVPVPVRRRSSCTLSSYCSFAWEVPVGMSSMIFDLDALLAGLLRQLWARVQRVLQVHLSYCLSFLVVVAVC